MRSFPPIHRGLTFFGRKPEPPEQTSRCAGCGRSITERLRRPCAGCGSINRAVGVTAGDGVAITDRVS